MQYRTQNIIMKNIIFLCGFCRSGKDYFADKLMNKESLEEYNLGDFPIHLDFSNCLRLSFAHQLKLLFSKQNNIDILYLEENKERYRHEIIKFAKEIRKYNDAYFAEHVLEKIKESDKELILITDLRFKIEYETILNVYDDIKIFQIERIGQVASNESDFSFINEIDFQIQKITYSL